MIDEIKSYFTGYECSRCHKYYSGDALQTVCRDEDCGRPLIANYDLNAAQSSLSLETLKNRSDSMWRYGEVLLVDPSQAITLGEGLTPLLPTDRLGAIAQGSSDTPFHLWVKDESSNPTGSFKARGLCMAISVLNSLDASAAALPTAGNAGAAAAAYAARAGMDCHVAMPADTPQTMMDEVKAYGAHLYTVDGLIGDAAKIIRKGAEEENWFDLSTLKEPYRVEGKKTMGYELWEQFGGKLPDAILYPTGGGTGLIGMWKAFQELIEMGLYEGSLPRMYAVQSTGCAPIVHAFKTNQDRATAWQNANTIAPGIRIPTPFADDLILAALKDSGGGAVEVTDENIKLAMKTMSHVEGIDACPEGAATFAALAQLIRQAEIRSDEDVVLFNTGTGLKHPELR